jgi:hypothetical protein
MTFSTAFAGAHRITAEAWPPGAVDSGTVPLGTWTVPASPAPALSSCDVNHDGNTDVSNVQLAIDAALGASPPAFHLNQTERLTVTDVQIVVNAVRGMGCWAAQ